LDEVVRLRRQIDQIDLEIIKLLKDRYESARLLGRIKGARHLPLRDPHRERNIIRKMDRAATTLGLDQKPVRSIYRQIFALAVKAQKRNVATENELENLSVLVIGGTGGMGRFFAQLMTLNGASVKIVGTRPSKTQRVAKEIEIEAGSIEDSKISDIVIITVPIETTRKVALGAGAKMKDRSLLIELSSVKTGIADRIAEGTSTRKEFVSLHPLFSSDVHGLNGQNIIAIPFRRGPLWQKFSKALTKAGASVKISSVKKHDLAMSYVQVIHHFALLSIGLSLSKWSGNSPTNSLMQTETRIRSVLRNWQTIMGIQVNNPYAQQARDQIVSTTRRFREMKPSDRRVSKRMLAANVQKWTRKT